VADSLATRTVLRRVVAHLATHRAHLLEQGTYLVVEDFGPQDRASLIRVQILINCTHKVAH
jgi:hypothetical protein